MISRRKLLPLLLLILVVLGGVVGYSIIEGWSLLDSLWMVFITLTTVGYGEVHPLSEAGRWFTLGLIVSGLGVGTYAISMVTSMLLGGEIIDIIQRRRRLRVMKGLHDHYIVIGYGRLGRVVTEELRRSGFRICVIERDPAASDQEDFPVIIGDGSDDEILRQASIDNAQGVAVTVAPVAEAIFVTLSARQFNAEVPIITRVDGEASAAKARRAGATHVVSPHAMGGWRMAHGLVRPHATSFLDVATLAEHPEIMLDEIEVHSDCRWCGRSLGELSVGARHRVLVVAIRHRDGTILATPSGSAVLQDGDVAIVVGAPPQVRAFAEVLNGEPQIGNGIDRNT